MWYEARIVKIDENDNLVKVHFNKWPSKFDEWMDRDTDRLAPHFSRAWKVRKDWVNRAKEGTTNTISQNLIDDDAVAKPGTGTAQSVQSASASESASS